MDTPTGLSIFCLDQSESAFGSEDYAGRRWDYQADIIEALAERLNLQQATRVDTGHLPGLDRTYGEQQSLCLLSCSTAKVLCSPISIAERAPALARLHRMLPCCSPSSNIASALKLAALVANAAGTSSITVFIAGPCSMASAGTPGLASALAKHHLTIVSLATAAELGTDAVAALQSLIDTLNELSGACASKMVFLEPPPQSLEHWQHLEQALELLERQDTQNRSTASPSSGPDQDAPQAPDQQDHQNASLAAARSGVQARELPRQWYTAQPLLARRSGVYQSAVCRNESLDMLGHLSCDGCMRPWLPSYANLQKAATEPPVHLQHQLCLSTGPKWRVLLESPAGMMRKARTHAAAPGGLASSETSAPGKRLEDRLPNHLQSHVKDPGPRHGARSKGQGASVTNGQPPELSLDGNPPPCDQAGTHCAPSSGTAPLTAQRKRRGSAQPRKHKPCTARHPLRLEADSRSGRIMLVETTDQRRLLRLLWCPSNHDGGRGAMAPPSSTRSQAHHQSIWGSSSPSEESTPPEGMLTKLPEHELKMALDPAAVSFSTTHSGQVLAVEQAVPREGHLGQSPKYKGVYRSLTADGNLVDRCFFWHQDTGAHVPSTAGARHDSPKAVGEKPRSAGEAEILPERHTADTAEAPEARVLHGGRMQQHISAAQLARMLLDLVQSTASRAHRDVPSCPALPWLHISGSLQVSFELRGIESQHAYGSQSSAAGGVQQERCSASDGLQPQLGAAGPFEDRVGPPGSAALGQSSAPCMQLKTCGDLGSGHTEHAPASGDEGCGVHMSQESTVKSFQGQMDVVVAASGEARAEAGQDYCEDSALYELD